MRIGLVGCTKSKLGHAAPAQDLYSPSALFRGRRSFVERTCERWYVLSAKHGVLAPEGLVDPYDETLVGKSPSVKREWSERVLAELGEVVPSFEGLTFEIHAGQDYWAYGLRDGLERRGADTVIPAEGLAQGQQLAFYANDGDSPVRRPGERPHSRPATPRSDRSNSRGSYAPLRDWLQARDDPRVALTFGELEGILGRTLPASARNHRAWWANHSETHSHARAWLEAGWEVAEVNLMGECVVFRRVHR